MAASQQGIVAARAATVRAAEASDGATQGNFVWGITLSLLATGAVAALIAFGTVRSIRRIASSTRRLASGDTDVDIAAMRRRDELGAIVEERSRTIPASSPLHFIACPFHRVPVAARGARA